jgi:hypothetical protein
VIERLLVDRKIGPVVRVGCEVVHFLPPATVRELIGAVDQANESSFSFVA